MDDAMTYRLISTKGTETISGTYDEAIAAAIEMEQRLQPSFGISVEDEFGITVAEIQNGVNVDE